jgi:hypothetical protein
VPAPPRAGITPYVRWGRGIEAALVGVTAGGLLLAGLLWRRRSAATDRAVAEQVPALLRSEP